MSEEWVNLAYLMAGILFVLALRWLTSPPTARRGVLAGEAGMLVAVVATLVKFEIVEYQWIVVA
ncbi:MAG: NAD(P)(+) transhydrogenase (Re/Si-specific) subunit beta, partial [Actinobacteria bacterium]|nr:NAD(P)(+) transhydrogenase (Re/Si-specific) subunit beta [Actinomycetota bacterium]